MRLPKPKLPNFLRRRPPLLPVVAFILFIAAAGFAPLVWQRINRAARITAHTAINNFSEEISIHQKEQSLTLREDIDLAKKANYIGSSSYKAEELSKSKISHPERGRLYLLKQRVSGITFVSAFTGSAKFGADLPIAKEWEVTDLGEDGMWLPGACAQKPSWVIGGRYVLIDDGPQLALFDTHKKTFRYFGSTGDDDPRGERVLLTEVKDGKLTLYVDKHDPDGALMKSKDFKHDSSIKDPFIYRREIHPEDLSYDEFAVEYSKPPVTFYTLRAYFSGVKKVISYASDAGEPKQAVLNDQSAGSWQNMGAQEPINDKAPVDEQSTFNNTRTDILRNIKEDYPELFKSTGTTVDSRLEEDRYSLKLLKTVVPRYGFEITLNGLGATATVPGVYNRDNRTLSLVIAPGKTAKWQNIELFTMGTM